MTIFSFVDRPECAPIRPMKSRPRVGTTGELQFTVAQEHVIDFATDGMPAVLSTPRLIGLIERTAREAMYPFLAGGHMIREVFEQSSTWADPPAKFEAGTCPFVEAVALGTAIPMALFRGIAEMQPVRGVADSTGQVQAVRIGDLEARLRVRDLRRRGLWVSIDIP